MQKTLNAVFFSTKSGREPVKEFFKKDLNSHEIEKIYGYIRTIERSWPLGKPLVDHIKGKIWEIRCTLNNRIARVLFAIIDKEMILLHRFIKKSQKTPIEEIQLTESRLREYEKYT